MEKTIILNSTSRDDLLQGCIHDKWSHTCSALRASVGDTLIVRLSAKVRQLHGISKAGQVVLIGTVKSKFTKSKEIEGCWEGGKEYPSRVELENTRLELLTNLPNGKRVANTRANMSGLAYL